MRNSYLSSSFNSVVSLDMDSSWAAKSWDQSNSYWNQNGNQVVFNKTVNKDTLSNDQDPILATNLNRGKVRQLFLERRGKGWDRSNPLEPIKLKSKSNKTQKESSLTKSLSNISDYYSNSKQSDKVEFFNFPTRLPNIGGTMQQRENSATSRKMSRIPQPKSSPKTNLPTEMRKLTLSSKKPTVQSDDSSMQKSDLKPSTPKNDGTAKTVKKVLIDGRSTPVERIPSTQVSSTITKTKANQLPQPSKKTNVNLDPDKDQCPICGRIFLKDRIQIHVGICKKAATKKRKVFDPVKQRIAGTEAEPYLKKGTLHTKAASTKVQDKKPKSDWRKKHEEFITSIRAAKQIKDHLAKGGKLSDLPPPPPMDTSDYIQCQHCGRKFNGAVAERHIPICSKVKSNKPTTKRSTKK